MRYDANATRERILAAATTEFARHGVAGARIDRIAAAAKANKRAIYDYYGDKDALFAAVLKDQLSRCAEEVPLDGDDLPGFVRGLIDYHAAHPESLRLMLWEALEYGTGEVPAEVERRAKYAGRAAAIAAGKPGTDPRLLLFFSMGLVNWPNAAPQLRRMILGDDYSPDDLREAIVAAASAIASPARTIQA
jgi:AcrR family transcriptional regulator